MSVEGSQGSQRTKHHARVVVVGGGVAAGHFAAALGGREAECPASERPLCVVLSAYPQGIGPYDRSRVSKDALDCTQLTEDTFPSLTLPSNVALWSGTVCTSVQPDYKRLTYKSADGTEGELTYEKLVIATGSRARVLDEDHRYLWHEKHADIIDDGSPGDGEVTAPAPAPGPAEAQACAQANAPAPAEARAPPKRIRPWCLDVSKNCGFGSVHYVRDIGDAAKLAEAVACVEEDGQETCHDPVVIVGGGVLTMELAAKISRFRGDNVPVTVVLSRDRIMPKLFREDCIDKDVGAMGAKDVSDFYERQLVKVGVKFVREHKCIRLWDINEHGEFPTVGGPAISLQRTRPRRFEPLTGAYFSTCRGIVVENNNSQERSWIAAKCVVLCLGDATNSSVFSFLDLAEDQSIIVDDTCRASHSSGDVFAVGDVASYPLPRSKERCVRVPHYAQAVSTASYVASACVEALQGRPSTGSRGSRRSMDGQAYDPVPCASSHCQDLDWVFYGRNVGECVPLGFDGNTDRYFGCFWVQEARVVGCFLEGASDEEKATGLHIAETRPRISRLERFRSLELEDFLDDPLRLEPPILGPGEFHAELDAKYISLAFKRYDSSGDGQAKTSCVGDLMRDLGADWDTAEEAEALRALDPLGSNLVSLEAFSSWWLN